MKISEFKDKFKSIKDMGFVRAKRSGATGIGYTLESLLEITENNKAQPDIDGAELKAHRTNVNGLITLFTFNNKVWKMHSLDAVKEYGSKNKDGRHGLYYTMSLKPNSAGLFLDVRKTEISVRHISGEVVAVWQLQTLADRFMQKIPALLFVSTFTEERDGVEYFHYYRAQLMKGTSPELLSDQFRAENILVDLRLHDKGTMARNHGTGFRTYEDKLPLLFNNIKDL
ncbi:MAG: MvaI/BcnI family restriction endonuclease [Endomicrobium sp.]|nr:MvaI/BcnI family restriction endonuclease [Endomicrobium sp.]